MSPEQQNVERWRKEAVEKGATHFLDVLDSFDYTHYPVYVMPDEDLNEVKAKFNENMQSVYGTYKIEGENDEV